MAFSTRQPFAEIGSPRLQALASIKNCQNAIVPDFSAPGKNTLSTPRKRRAASVLEDQDSENVDPSTFTFSSPTKKAKTASNEGLCFKPTNFSLLRSPTNSSPPSTTTTTTPSIPSVRKALASPKSITANSTPINLSRGSPKHKRIGLLSKRRSSSSPFRRIDPPSFSHHNPSLPFSIDAALKGTIPDYTPRSSVAMSSSVATMCAPVSALEESMPKSWFFDIHEDTPEQEAANLMEHSAAILDISSDDDCKTKRRTAEMERGKENIPPPDFVPFQPTALDQPSADVMETNEPVISEHVKLPRLRMQLPQDAMDEDRQPLSDLPAADYYGEGLDASSYVIVDGGIDNPSGLAIEFDFTGEAPEDTTIPEESEVLEESAVLEETAVLGETTSAEEKIVELVVEEEMIQIFVDVTTEYEPTAALQEDLSTSGVSVSDSDAHDVSSSTAP